MTAYIKMNLQLSDERFGVRKARVQNFMVVADSKKRNISLQRLGKNFMQKKKCICLGATSIFAFVLLNKVQHTDSPTISFTRAFHRSSIRQHSNNTEQTQKLNEKQIPESMSRPESSAQAKHAQKNALWGMFIADAIAMPVHWYYNPNDIKKSYGTWLTGYVAPNSKHPSSIMSLSNVGGSGRGSDTSSLVIGNVILHDKLKYWTRGNGSVHYHQGMKAGDNTLNALMALQIMKTFERVDPEVKMSDRDVRGEVLKDYVTFMTTPGSHKDTYAESFHRSFFKDWSSLPTPPQSAEDLLEFAEERYKKKTKSFSDHQLLVVGALVPTIPWVLRNVHKSESECAKAAVEFVKLTHPDMSLVPFVDMYARLLHGVVNGHDLKAECLKLLSHSELGGPSKRDMVVKMLERAQSGPKGSKERLRAYQSAVSSLGLACYIEGAMSSLLYLALEFSDDFEGGVLANANVGGENCHRGAALGALLGAASAYQGETIPVKFKDGLCTRDDITTILSQMKI